MQIKWKAWDIENDSSKQLGRKAGHFLYDPIVSMAMYDGKKSEAKYVFNDFLGQAEFLEKLFKDCNLIVGHNLKHDFLFIWDQPIVQQWFKDGGRIWDTQYAEYRLQGMGRKLKDLGLRQVATEVYNIPERSKHIDDLLFSKEAELRVKESQNTPDPLPDQVSKLPKELVLEDNRNDVEDAGQVFLKQFKKVQNLNMLNAIWLNMDTILALCEIEFQGMKYNLSTLEKTKLKLEHELQIEYDKINALVVPYWR